MASLFIKDSETAELATELAIRLGTTKTNAVRDTLRRRIAELQPIQAESDFVEWMKAHRAANPLPPQTGLKADKAFFDEMWGEI